MPSIFKLNAGNHAVVQTKRKKFFIECFVIVGKVERHLGTNN